MKVPSTVRYIAYSLSLWILSVTPCRAFEGPGTSSEAELKRLAYSIVDVELLAGEKRYFGRGKSREDWLSGGLTSQKGSELTDLIVRFDLHGETLEVLQQNKVYLISKSMLASFFIVLIPDTIRFESGYKLIDDFQATLSFSGSGQIDQSINDINAVLANDLTGTLEAISIRKNRRMVTGRIQLITNDPFKLNLLVSALQGIQGMEKVEIVSEIPEFVDYDLLHIMNQGEIRLVKRYTTTYITGRPNFLTNDVYSSFTISSDHYLSGPDKILVPISLSRSDVLDFLTRYWPESRIRRIQKKNGLHFGNEDDVSHLIELLLGT